MENQSNAAVTAATVADIVIKNQRRRCTRAFFSLYADAFICAEKRIEHSKVCSFWRKYAKIVSGKLCSI